MYVWIKCEREIKANCLLLSYIITCLNEIVAFQNIRVLCGEKNIQLATNAHFIVCSEVLFDIKYFRSYRESIGRTLRQIDCRLRACTQNRRLVHVDVVVLYFFDVQLRFISHFSLSFFKLYSLSNSNSNSDSIFVYAISQTNTSQCLSFCSSFTN